MATTTVADATLSASAIIDDQAQAIVELPPRLSIVDRFLEVRRLERNHVPRMEASKPRVAQHGAQQAALVPQGTMWRGYTKRLCGDRSAFARRAMRAPDESYSDSADVYNPKKLSMTFIKVHEDADDVSRQFWYRTRSLFFERQVVDGPVCDLMANQELYDTALDRIHATNDDDGDAVDGAVQEQIHGRRALPPTARKSSCDAKCVNKSRDKCVCGVLGGEPDHPSVSS